MTTILVTGGAGYIGSHACKALAARGYLPVTYDNLSTGHAGAVKWGPLEQGDLADRQRLDAVLAQYRPEAVLHFAGSCYVGESIEHPEKYYRNNVVGTLVLLEAMLARAVDRIVFSSSCATYGVSQTVPIVETMAQSPINPYGRTKWMIEIMLRDFSAAHGLAWTALRYFNAAGADPDGEIGEDHDPETHLIPLALHAAAGTGPALTIFGDDYDTPDGTCIRDYVHVSDLADAHVLALAALLDGAESAAFNLGTGRGHSVREVIDAVERVTGRKVPFKIGPRRPGDPAVLVADATLAQSALGWSPAMAGLDGMVRTAWDVKRRCD